MWIVQIALRRPYTFVVLALLIAIFGVLAALRTPIDIFPDINIPVVSVVWTYNGLAAERHVRPHHHFYERYADHDRSTTSSTSNRSRSSGYRRRQDLLPAGRRTSRRAGAGHRSRRRRVLKLLPPGITPPLSLSYNASSVPILQLALSSKHAAGARSSSISASNFIRPQLATVAGRRPAVRPTAARCARCRSTSTSRRCRRTASPPTT